MHVFGALTSYLDVAQVVLYVFWIFFAGLIYYLHRENKREGYPLESERSPYIRVQGFPAVPPPKTFKLPHGGTATVPRVDAPEVIKAAPAEKFLGAPLVPTGNSLADGVGPGAYAQRSNTPELTYEGHPRMVPMRVVSDITPEPRDPDLRGQPVFGGDRVQAGVVKDVWVDLSEPQIRFIEVALTGSARSALVPITFVTLQKRRRQVHVKAILASQFPGVPALANPDQVTLLEEDRIAAYYGAGLLYATAKRPEPFL
jgi:photosynthetic reaction center H subunit